MCESESLGEEVTDELSDPIPVVEWLARLTVGIVAFA